MIDILQPIEAMNGLCMTDYLLERPDEIEHYVNLKNPSTQYTLYKMLYPDPMEVVNLRDNINNLTSTSGNFKMFRHVLISRTRWKDA